MAQYMAVYTGNLLDRREDCYRWGVETFPGLLDGSSGIMYDHPENSFNKVRGMKTALELGTIIFVHTEVSDVSVDWRTRLTSFNIGAVGMFKKELHLPSIHTQLQAV